VTNTRHCHCCNLDRRKATAAMAPAALLAYYMRRVVDWPLTDAMINATARLA
jgi:hypothetical protein